MNKEKNPTSDIYNNRNKEEAQKIAQYLVGQKRAACRLPANYKYLSLEGENRNGRNGCV